MKEKSRHAHTDKKSAVNQAPTEDLRTADADAVAPSSTKTTASSSTPCRKASSSGTMREDPVGESRCRAHLAGDS